MVSSIGMKIFITIVSILCSLSSLSQAVAAKIDGAEMSAKLNKKQEVQVKGWKIVGNKQALKLWKVGVKDGKDVNALAIGRGVMLETKMSLPELVEKEQKIKGEWFGLLSVDAYSVKGSASIKLELVDKEGKKLYTQKFSTKPRDVMPRGAIEGQTEKGIRLLAALDSTLVKVLMEKDVVMKLSLDNSGVAVLSGVEVSRFNVAPTRKLENKPNGQSGPDKVNVGSLGFNLLVEHKQRASSVYDVKKDSLAAQAGLKNGDVLIGLNGVALERNIAEPGWAWFDHGHASTMGRAILSASAGSRKQLKLNVLRDGKVRFINVKLPTVHLSENFFLKKDGDKLKADMIDYLVKNQNKDGGYGSPVRTTFAALSLLSEHDEKYAEPVFRAVNWMLNKYPNAENFGNLGYWYASYAGILYCEYYLATGDERVLPRIVGIHDWVMTGVHTSKWGMACLGHGTGGLPYGNKALMAPASHLLVFDGLAQKCGVKTQLWETLLPYMEHCWSDPKKGGHGSMGYNASYKDKAQFWSRTGQSALACAIRGERKDMQDAMTGFMANNYPYYRNSHAYGEPGGAWGIMSLAYARPDAYAKVMNAYRWEFALSWEPGFGMRFSQPHMGAPYMGTDDLVNSAYPLVFNAHKKNLFITGGSELNWLDVSKLAKPLTDVVLRREKDGKVWMECRVPGNPIHYTTDGSEPTKDSKQYSSSFDLVNGGVVKAVSILNDKSGKVATRDYPPHITGMVVAAASGHVDAKEAIRRASYSIDGAPYLAWHADVGEGSVGYPHYVVYDLGKMASLEEITFSQGGKEGGVGKYKVSGAIHPWTRPIDLTEGAWTSFAKQRQIKVKNPAKVRFIRVDFIEPLDEGKKNFKILELSMKLNGEEALKPLTATKKVSD